MLRKTSLSVAAVGGCAVALWGALPAAAAATSVWVTAGSATSGSTVNVTLTAGAISLKDLTTGFTGNCPASTSANPSRIPGTVKAGPGQSPNGIGQLNGAGALFPSNNNGQTGCRVSGSLPLPITGSQTWALSATNPSTPTLTTAPQSGQTTPVTISNIKLSVQGGASPSTASCTFDVVGSLSGTYTNGNPSTLTIPAVTTAAASNLTITNFQLRNGSTKCVGGFFNGNGDKFALGTTYTATANTAAQNPVWLSAR